MAGSVEPKDRKVKSKKEKEIDIVVGYPNTKNILIEVKYREGAPIRLYLIIRKRNRKRHLPESLSITAVLMLQRMHRGLLQRLETAFITRGLRVIIKKLMKPFTS